MTGDHADEPVTRVAGEGLALRQADEVVAELDQRRPGDHRQRQQKRERRARRPATPSRRPVAMVVAPRDARQYGRRLGQSDQEARPGLNCG